LNARFPALERFCAATQLLFQTLENRAFLFPGIGKPDVFFFQTLEKLNRSIPILI
jgi:hypothetical protein